MPQRNGPRSLKGRSAIARRAINTNSTNGMMSQQNFQVINMNGTTSTVRGGYFGGPKKGGSPPSATGFMIPSGTRAQIAVGKAPPASRPNYLFRMLTAPGPSPFGYGPYA